MLPIWDPMVIVIDALNECGEKDEIAEFIEVVIDACQENRPLLFRVFSLEQSRRTYSTYPHNFRGLLDDPYLGSVRLRRWRRHPQVPRGPVRHHT